MAPRDSGEKRAYVCPLIQPASEAVRTIEFLFMPNLTIEENLEYNKYPPLECCIPLGSPVEPDVNSVNNSLLELKDLNTFKLFFKFKFLKS